MTPVSDTRSETLDPLWYKDAVIYQMHVKAFQDGNGDGIGDFAGLVQRLDYIQELGVNTIWLLPFYPSPLRDDGYDIATYTDVHPDYGTLDDFRAFVAEAHRRNLKVITELVINHTSDQHPWFQAARRAPPGSPEREFYVWSDTDKKFPETRIIFTDTEASNWAWDPIAKAYYWHRFFSHQPDLNHNNPGVVDAVIDVMRFWMDIGVDGMRLDAIPYLCVREGTSNENLPETHAVLKKMRAAMDAHYSGRMFLAEANQWPEDVREYFGDGDECHMAYHFPLMPRIFMAVALEDRYPIAEIMRQTPDIPENCQWAIFLRNHDELTLEMVTDSERDYMYKMYAHEPRMRVNVGIRRRLAPLLSNDVDRIKLMNSLLLSMPGSPIIYYGDEIGMGDNIYIGDRNGVRTPMQWSIDRNAGFSRTDPQRLYLPIIMDPIYGYQAVNVEVQSRDPSSLLNWTRRILAVRRQYQCFGRGALEFVRPQNRKVLAYIRCVPNEIVLCVANLSQTAQAVELELSRYKGRVPVEMMGRNAFPPIGELPYFLTLPAHGFFWLLLSDTEAPPAWHVERLPATELPVLVLNGGIRTFLANGTPASDQSVPGRTLNQLQKEVLKEFLLPRRWFAGKGHGPFNVKLGARSLWESGGSAWLFTLLDIEFDGGQKQSYFLPLAIAWEGVSDNVLRTTDWSLAKVREHSRVGALVDAFADPNFCIALARGVQARTRIPFDGGELRFEPTPACAELIAMGIEPVQQLGREQSNTSVVLGEALFVKGYRQARPGINPDVEIPGYLTAAGFKYIAPLAGSVQYAGSDQQPMTLVALFGYVRNQGDGWSYALNHLDRYASTLLADQQADSTPHALFNTQMRTLGRRIGELHAVLARETSDPAFAPEPIKAQDLGDWRAAMLADTHRTLDPLQRQSASLPEPLQSKARLLLAARERLVDRIDRLTLGSVDAVKTRHHGDLHLGQVLLTADDFLITDFEGEPARSIEERRRKHSALRDVAGMLRSFDYARAVALDRALTARPDLHERLQQGFHGWYEEASNAFLAGYHKGAAGARILPSKPEEARRLIALFQIEKALYELRYELENRPAWAGVPIDGLLALAGAVSWSG
jgi:maltose alpha-D-glucosyltransferase/alpha-amylase